MAAKKVSEKKVAVKKVSEKKSTSQKSGKSSKIVIKVPQGNQVIRTFNLTPSLPVNGKPTNWQLVEADAKKPKDIDSIRVSFSVDSSALEQEFERAILVLNIQQNTSDKGIWRFASKGVAVNPKFSDVDHDVVIEIVNQGMTLIAQVQVIGDTQEEIKFGYLASYTDASGQVTVYESQDPGITPGRP